MPTIHWSNRRLALAAVAVGLLSAGQAKARAPAPAGAQAPRAAQQGPESAPAIEPKVVGILKTACATLEASKAMSFDALSTYEHAARNGQPLFYSVLNHVLMERPNKLRVIKQGDGVPDEFYYDGKTITAYVPSANLVATADAPPTIDQMLEFAWSKAAIYFPFDDVLASDPCAVFGELGVTSAFYVGQSKVIGGTTTDMVAVASPDVQAELWIGAADHLPRLVRVVYVHEPAHALYQTEYSNWLVSGSADPGAFASEPAAKARPMPFTPPGAGQEKPNPGAPHRQP